MGKLWFGEDFEYAMRFLGIRVVHLCKSGLLYAIVKANCEE
jgi:hypothetical protein